jgi:hypothetical protein
MGMTEDIAGFGAAFSLKTAPTELLPKVREAFLDSFGVMLAGSREESSQLAARCFSQSIVQPSMWRNWIAVRLGGMLYFVEWSSLLLSGIVAWSGEKPRPKVKSVRCVRPSQ